MCSRRLLVLSIVPAALAIIGACVGDEPSLMATDDAGTEAEGSADATTTPDAADSPCRLDAAFGAPLLVPGLESADNDSTPSLSSDEREIYFTRTAVGAGLGGAGIYRARRSTLRAAFETPAPFFDRPGMFDSDPLLWNDGALLFAVLIDGPAAVGSGDLYLLDQDGGATPVQGTNTTAYEANPFLTADGTELWFARDLPVDGGTQREIFRAKYANGAATQVAPVAELNLVSAFDEWPVLSADKKTIYFGSTRVDAVPPGTKENIWVARRADVAGPFDPPSPVAELNSAADDAPNWLSPDGCRLYLRSDRGGAKAIYMAERPR